MPKLDHKRALVTAGAQGIGLAISRQLLAAGCDVFVHYRSSAEAARGLEGEARALGRRYAHAGADDALWADVMALNVDSTRRVTRAAVPHLVAAAKSGGDAS